MEQLGFDAMPTKLFACTPSRLTTWSDCPRRYRFTYLDRPVPARGPAWAHNAVGAAAHLALARFWELPLERRNGLAARGLLDRAWSPDGFASPEQAHRWKDLTGDMVSSYVEGIDVLDEPRGVERTVAFTTPTLAVSGRIDRVDERDGELVVVDYQTGRRPLTEDDARGSLALALYVLGARRTFRAECSRVELHHLPTGTVHAWEHTDASLERHVRRAEELAAEASAADEFPARTSRSCAWCDFLRVCPEGQAASGGPQKPWAGLAEDIHPLDESA